MDPEVCLKTLVDYSEHARNLLTLGFLIFSVGGGAMGFVLGKACRG